MLKITIFTIPALVIQLARFYALFEELKKYDYKFATLL